MINIEDITFRYGDNGDPVLRNLSLTIGKGESVCVMGANGSGKSTLARILAGLLEVKQGRVRIEHDHSHQIPVGILFQNPDNQMVAVTVENEIAFALENLGIPLEEMESRITDTLERFRISHLRRRLTTELSGGEKQRVALASVMIFRPPVLVLDEPDSFLDEGGKATLKDEIVRIKAGNPSLVEIRITQYPSIARTYPRLIVLDRGCVVADDVPSKIFADREFCLKTSLGFSLRDKDNFVIPGLSVGGETGTDKGEIDSILLEKASFCYGNDYEILKELNFNWKAGEVIGLVGPSGSGKSTLGLLLCGLLKPTSGTITYNNADGEVVPRKNILGRVSGLLQLPERQFFLPTCTEEIAFGPENLGRPLDKATIDDFFAVAGLDADRFSSRDPFTLSGGEKRRLAFAAVLSMSPRFVVFDEPTCGLDQEGVGRFIMLGKALKKTGVGLIIISHDGDIINALTERVVCLNGNGGCDELSTTDFFASQQYASTVSSLTIHESDSIA